MIASIPRYLLGTRDDCIKVRYRRITSVAGFILLVLSQLFPLDRASKYPGHADQSSGWHAINSSNKVVRGVASK